MNKMGEEKDMMKMFLDLSNDAWMELMKQKIMKSYDKASGESMDKMADVARDHGMAAWMAMKEGKQMTDEQTIDIDVPCLISKK